MSRPAAPAPAAFRAAYRAVRLHRRDGAVRRAAALAAARAGADAWHSHVLGFLALGAAQGALRLAAAAVLASPLALAATLAF